MRLHGGFSRQKALLFNFLSAITAVLGTVAALFLGSLLPNFTDFLIPFGVGGFIYIAGSDLIPEIQREDNTMRSVLQVMVFVLGILVMWGLVLLE